MTQKDRGRPSYLRDSTISRPLIDPGSKSAPQSIAEALAVAPLHLPLDESRQLCRVLPSQSWQIVRTTVERRRIVKPTCTCVPPAQAPAPSPRPRALSISSVKRDENSDLIADFVLALVRRLALRQGRPFPQNLTDIDLARARDLLFGIANHLGPLRHPT